MTDPTNEAVVVTQAMGARFWAKVDRRGPDECWPWTGGVNGDGYGRFYLKRKKMTAATRVAWSLATGREFPADKLACHSCDNPGCVNPGHIWPGTQSDNIKDCANKGRHPSKPKTHCQRGHELTDENRIPMAGGGSRCRACARVGTRERMRRLRARKAQTHG